MKKNIQFIYKERSKRNNVQFNLLKVNVFKVRRWVSFLILKQLKKKILKNTRKKRSILIKNYYKKNKSIYFHGCKTKSKREFNFCKGFFRTFQGSFSLKRVKNVYDRNLRITTQMVGYRFKVYNGKIYRPLLINLNHVGFRFGEFSFTRRFGPGSELHMRRKKKIK